MQLLNQKFLLFYLSIFPLFLTAQASVYPIDSWHSTIGFSVKFGGLFDVHGRFNDFSGSIALDEKDLSKTSATVLIDVKTIDTGVDLRDNHLKSEDFFNTEKYPQISFSSTGVFKDIAGKPEMVGKLTMLGHSKEVHIPFELLHGERKDPWKNFRVSLKGAFTIDRTDFGMDDDKAIGKEVNIQLTISARVLNMESIALFTRPLGKAFLEKMNNGGMEEAKQVFEEMRIKGDEDAKKPSSLAFFYYKMQQEGNIKKALQVCEYYVEQYPTNASAHSLLGQAYLENDQIEKAKKAFEQALTLDPNNPNATEFLKLIQRN